LQEGTLRRESPRRRDISEFICFEFKHALSFFYFYISYNIAKKTSMSMFFLAFVTFIDYTPSHYE